MDIINNSSVNNDIIVLGKQPIGKIPTFLHNSSCLLTTASTYISGGFPTKLGEYLLSGVPVVVTKAGEIPNYLEDGKNAFLCEVDDLEQIADKLYYVHTHIDEADSVGLAGRQLALSKFNISTYIDSLVNFLS